MVLNLLFIVCSLPVITIGASLTGLFYCCLLMAKKRERTSVVRAFFSSFKQNFKQATAVWVVSLICFFLLGFNTYTLAQQESLWASAFFIASALLLILLFVLCLYFFPVLAAFENSVKNLLKNAAIFAFTHFPTTLLLTAATVLPLYFTYADVRLQPVYVFGWAFFGFSVLAYIVSFFMYRVFKPYLPADEEAPAEQDTYEPGGGR